MTYVTNGTSYTSETQIQEACMSIVHPKHPAPWLALSGPFVSCIAPMDLGSTVMSPSLVGPPFLAMKAL